MKIKAVIFDLDGVLCFTDKYHYQAWKTVADELEIPFDEKVNDLLRGVSRMESLEIILRRGNKQNIRGTEKIVLASRKNNVYCELLKTLTPEDVAIGSVKLLKELKNMNIKTAIGSSSKNTKFILRQLELTSYFDAIVDGNDIKNSKPDPEVFLKAAQEINENPKDCIVIEDAQAGIAAANKGGFISVSIGKAVDQNTSNYHIEKLLDLLNIINN